jgi:MFS family permease
VTQTPTCAQDSASVASQVEDASAVPAVVAVFFVHGLLFASWTAHIPQVTARLGIGVGLLGVALLAAPIGAVVAMSASAYLVPRFGSRRVVRTAMIGYCLAGALLGVCDTLAAFFLAYSLWGALQGALEVAMNTQAITVESSLRRPIMPVFHGGWSLGALVGAAVGTLGVILGVSLSAQLLLLGLPSLIVLGFMTKRLQPGRPARPSTARPLTPRRNSSRVVSLAILLLCVVALADMLCEGAAADWSAVYLRGSLHAGTAIAGLGYTLYALAMVSTRLSASQVLRRWPTRRLLPILTSIATVGFAGGWASHSQVVMLVAFTCLGLGCALVIPTSYSAVGHISAASTGGAVALVSGSGWLGFVAGPPLIGEIATATSLHFALLLVPLLTALITVLTATSTAFRTPSVPQEGEARRPIRG